MFNHINKKSSSIFSFLVKVPFYKIRSSANLFKKFRKEGENIDTTLENVNNNVKNSQNPTMIDLSFEKLQKELGLTLKPNSQPRFYGKDQVNKKLNKLEQQLEEITLKNENLSDLRKENLSKTMGNHLQPHSISKPSHKVQTLQSRDKKAQKTKKTLENQLEPVDFKVTAIEDLKDSPNEILLKNYQEQENKKNEKSEYQVGNYLKGEEGIDYVPAPDKLANKVDKETAFLRDSFEKLYDKFLGADAYVNSDGLAKLDWIEKKETQEVITF